MELCKNCKSEFLGNFCSHCGQAQTLRRIDRKYVLSEIGSVLNFDKGIFYTIKELIVRPGQNARDFIQTDRNRLVKPIVFILICSFTYTILQKVFGFEDGYFNYSFDQDSAKKTFFDWVTRNYGYLNILISIFIALWIKILFKKHSYNFFEILILLCFIVGIEMLIFSFLGVIDSFVNLTIIGKGFFIGIIYVSWGIGQFFNGNRVVNGLKGFLSYLLGLLSFMLIIQIVGFILDWINK